MTVPRFRRQRSYAVVVGREIVYWGGSLADAAAEARRLGSSARIEIHVDEELSVRRALRGARG